MESGCRFCARFLVERVLIMFGIGYSLLFWLLRDWRVGVERGRMLACILSVQYISTARSHRTSEYMSLLVSTTTQLYSEGCTYEHHPANINPKPHRSIKSLSIPSNPTGRSRLTTPSHQQYNQGIPIIKLAVFTRLLNGARRIQKCQANHRHFSSAPFPGENAPGLPRVSYRKS